MNIIFTLLTTNLLLAQHKTSEMLGMSQMSQTRVLDRCWHRTDVTQTWNV